MSTCVLTDWCSSHGGCLLLGMYRPGDGPCTGFVAETPDGGCIFLSASHCFLERESRGDLKALKPTEGHKLLQGRILRYYYWFCYKERQQHVQLMGKDFVAASVKVDYDVVGTVASCKTLGYTKVI